MASVAYVPKWSGDCAAGGGRRVGGRRSCACARVVDYGLLCIVRETLRSRRVRTGERVNVGESPTPPGRNNFQGYRSIAAR